MRITKVIAMGMALSTMQGEGADSIETRKIMREVKQTIHGVFLDIGDFIVKSDDPECKFELVDMPGTQNAHAITFPNGKRRIEVDEDWYSNLPDGEVWGIVYVMGHEIGHFYLQDRYKEWERTATTEQRQLAADYFAGHVSAEFGLTKEQATWALVDTQHHNLNREDWGARIRAAEAGWTAGKARRPLR